MRIIRHRAKNEGLMMTESVVALGIIALAVFPLAFGFLHEAQYSRACYQRAVAMEIVDGEMEILAAGEWRTLGQGTHNYVVRAPAAAQLPPGQFRLLVDTQRLRLEWVPAHGGTNGIIRRERTLTP